MAELSAPDIRTQPLVAASQATVSKMFAERDDSDLLYHSLSHTEDVVEAADRIASLSDFTPEEHELLLIAAWWHDTGMLNCAGNPIGHERTSCQLAADFLQSHGASDESIEKVKELILATDMAGKPDGKLAQAMRDADLSGLGRPDYRKRLKKLRKEWDAQGRLNVADRIQWLEENIAFFQAHSFLTPAAERLYGKQKERNLEIIEGRLAKRKKKKDKKKSKSSKSPIQSEKSAQMMLKTTLRNNIDLTSIADGKANIMLSINAAILTLGMPLLAAYIPQFPYLVFPAGFLLITCVATIVYATLATRPVRTSGKTDLDSISTGKTNLFFFGNYYNMPLDKYKEGLRAVFANQEVLDSSVMNDLYWLGVALGEKFNRLRICYAVFLVGMVLSATSFVVSFYWSGPLTEAVELPENVIIPAGDSIRY